MTARTVVVSPHLDDAVLSCCARLTAGARVVTVFAGLPAEGTPGPVWDRLTGAADAHRRVCDRLAEDDGALRLLGVGTDRLDLLDGQYRDGPAPHGRVTGLLRPLLADCTEVWLPAGVGGHRDHVAARDAGLAAAPPDVAVLLYADLPYALVYGWPGWVDGAAARPLLDPTPWLEAELESVGLDPAALLRAPRTLNDDLRHRKQEAMACYVSQLPALDAQSGGRLGDPAVLAHELAWSVRPGATPVRRDWVPGGSG